MELTNGRSLIIPKVKNKKMAKMQGKMNKKKPKPKNSLYYIAFLLLFIFISLYLIMQFYKFSTTGKAISTTCPEDNTIFKIDKSTGGHAGRWDSTTYTNEVCNTGSSGHDCTGSNAVIRLAKTDNSHVEKKGLTTSNYFDVCFGDLICTYAQSCPAGNECIASISKDTNAQIGDCNAYSEKVCCKISDCLVSGYSCCSPELGSGNHYSSLDATCDTGEQCRDSCATPTAPVVSDIPSVGFNEDSSNNSIDLDDYVTDDSPDTDMAWSYSGNTNVNVNIDSSSHIVAFTAAQNWYGSELITLTATDPDSLPDSGALTVTVNSVNDAPTITISPNLNLVEDITYVINLTNNISDADNTLDYLIVYENSSYATVDGKAITFNYQKPVNENVKVTVSDHELNASKIVSVAVTAVNDAPQFINPKTVFKVLQGTTLDYQFNASDEENDPITFSDNTTLFDINQTAGIIRYSPTATTLNETHSIKITASDNKGGISPIVVSLAINDTNFPPAITSFTPENLNPTLEAGYRYEFSYTANDPDNDVLEPKWQLDSNQPQINATFSYLPPDSDVGTHKLKLAVSDGLLNSNMQWNITITPENHAPVLASNIPSQELQQNSRKENAFDLDSYFYDEDNDTLIYTPKGNKNISIKINLVDHSVSLEPDNKWQGTEYVTFVANDGSLVAYSNNISFMVKSLGAVCGNNLKESGEECDGTDNSACGVYSCKSDCSCNKQEEEGECTPDWQCTDWSKCSVNSQQIRTCTDKKRCGKSEGKPEEKQSCAYTPTCSDGMQNQFEEGVDCGGPCKPCTKGLTPKRYWVWFWFIVPLILAGLIGGGVIIEAKHKAGKEADAKKKNMMQQMYQHTNLEEQKERELQHYIEIMFGRGFPETSIKKRLQQEGWPYATLDRIFGRINLHKKAEEKQAMVSKLIKKGKEEGRKKVLEAFK